MNAYQVWFLPEEKEKGKENKWIEQDLMEAKSRKEITSKLHSERKSGTWKVRKV